MKIYSAVDSTLPVPWITVWPVIPGGISTVVEAVEKEL
jgi:hypothetical protein